MYSDRAGISLSELPCSPQGPCPFCERAIRCVRDLLLRRPFEPALHDSGRRVQALGALTNIGRPLHVVFQHWLPQAHESLTRRLRMTPCGAALVRLPQAGPIDRYRSTAAVYPCYCLPSMQ